jgi:ribosomal protein S18 acetylase RimI-like enzyme
MTPEEPVPCLRILKSLEAVALRDLRHRAIREIPEAFGTPPAIELAKSAMHYRRQLLRMGIDRGELLLGLWRERDLLGMVGLGRRDKPGGLHGLIYSMYLLPELRGQGWGRRLLEEAEHRMRSLWQIERFELCVEVNNLPARRLYESAGFRILRTETNAFAIEGRPHDVYRMGK